jgi:hypothetical protein
MTLKKPLAEVAEADFDRCFGVNAEARVLRHAAAHRIWDNGRIINIGTMLLGAATGLYSVYAARRRRSNISPARPPRRSAEEARA